MVSIASASSPSNKASFRLFVRFISWMVRHDPKRASALFLIQIANALVPGANLFILSRIIERAIQVYQGSSGVEPIVSWVLTWAALQLFASFLQPLFSVQEEGLRQRLEETALRSMQDKTSRLRLEAFERADFHDLLARARKLTEPGFLFNITMELFSIFQSALSIVSVSAVVAWWNPWLLIAIVATSLPVPIAKWLEYKGKYTLEKKQIPTARLRNYLSSILLAQASAKEVRAFGMGDWLFARWKELFWQVEEENFANSRRHVGRYVSLYTLSAVGLAGGIAWCAASVAFGGLSAGRFSAVLLGLDNVSNGVRLVFERFSSLADRLLRIGDFFAYMDLGPEEEMTKQGGTPDSDRISLEGVAFRYPGADRDSLSDITLTLQPGERVALIGTNGSGKTTLVKLLLGLYRPTTGTIRYGHLDSEQVNVSDLRSRIAVVFQDYNKYSVSARDNIGFGHAAAIDDLGLIHAAAARSGADEVATGLPNGYDTQLTTRFSGGTDLSGGQWQKFAIARAFMRDAELIALDEPTAALDPKAESDVLRRFLEMAEGKTSVLVSHRLGLARFCDRILLMQEGRLVEQGTHADLLAAGGEYARLWSLQSQWYRESGA